eukprot:834571-Alexandrium_andersonii.AAC.1
MWIPGPVANLTPRSAGSAAKHACVSMLDLFWSRWHVPGGSRIVGSACRVATYVSRPPAATSM